MAWAWFDLFTHVNEGGEAFCFKSILRLKIKILFTWIFWIRILSNEVQSYMVV